MKAKLIVLGLAALLAGGGWLSWWLQSQRHQQRLAACRSLRSEITTTRSTDFEASRRQMAKVQLNDSQADTLRRLDPAAFDRYIAAFAERVNAVAAAADKLGTLVERYGREGCFDLR
ncbi:MAG: hypothetical protein VKN13_00905 [Cyanobacteriota bacterium]|nr:hypothetical protein [Cyanobacteriota bacterium]